MTARDRPTVGITGTTGYLGAVIRDRYREAGWHVIALDRRPPADPDQSWRRFDLAERPTEGLLDGIDVVVHCAYDMQAHRPADVWRRNVDGSRWLLDAARGAASPTVFMSSMSAHEQTEQVYGRAKLAIEQHAGTTGAIIVRPGLVWGPRAGGMAGTLRRLAGLPLVPLVAGAAAQFTAHEDDLAQAVFVLAAGQPAKGGPIGAAHPQPVPFRDLVAALARMDGRSVRFLPVGWRLPQLALCLLQRMPFGPALRADSLIGLRQPASELPGQDVVRGLGLSFRPLLPPVRLGAMRQASQVRTGRVSSGAGASSGLS